MPAGLPEYITRHDCIDCRNEVADDRIFADRKPRPIVTPEGKPKRCATHAFTMKRQQRKQARAKSIERTYDISAEDAHELLLLQGGRCWLCQKATGATKSLAVDHDHATNEVRGRLCGPCNQFIGRLGDDPAAAERLVGYLSGDTPYRRLRAKQLLDAVNASTTPVVVANVQSRGPELYAAWYFEGSPEYAFLTLVRLESGEWATERPTSEPRVETPGECGSCHALPDQPHTEYCNV